MANVLGTLFGEIADAIREKSGEGGTMKPAEFPDKIAQIVTGGGAVDGVATVYFCNYDGSALFSRQVFIGDDCPSPVTQNKLETPTRESTAQYDYTFNGWSLTDGGTASADALKNITADRTVYAAFAENLRYYTVRFYDGDTVMKTQSVAYGSTATPPDTEKEGYAFVEWTPSSLTIVGDTDFIGKWESDEGWLAWREFPNTTIATPSVNYRNHVLYSPDGTKLFVACDTALYMYDATVQPYSLLASYSLGGGVNDMAVNTAGSLLALSINKSTSTVSDNVFVYSIGSNNLTKLTVASGKASSSFSPDGIAFSPDGSTLYVSVMTSAYFVKINTSDLSWEYVKLDTSVAYYGTNDVDVCYSPDGKQLAVATPYNQSKSNGYIYNVVDGAYVAETKTLNLGTSAFGVARAVAYSPDGKYLAFGCDSNSNRRELVVFDTTTSPYTKVLDLEYGYTVNSVAFSHDGSMLAVGVASSPYIRVYDTGTWTERDAPLVLPEGAIVSCSFNNDLTKLAVAQKTSTPVVLYEVRV